MPPRRAAHKPLDDLIRKLFFCPGCSTWRTTPRLALSSSRNHSQLTRNKRYNSTLVSSTAVNAQKQVPARYRELHEALQNVQKKAPAYINLSRLQLALSGLESERPVTRVAVLGINKSTTARKVVRLLLADSLKEEETWERQLEFQEESHIDDGGILIRYGEPINPSLQPSRTAIQTISIPSPILQEHNLEILISSVFTPSSSSLDDTVDSDTFLTPFAGTPTSASGRQTIVTYPVHKALILANGLDEFQNLSQMLALTSYGAPSERHLITPVVNLDGSATYIHANDIMLLDTDHVAYTLQSIRESIDNAAIYERARDASGFPALSKWLSGSSISVENGTSKTLSQVVESILDAASGDIEQQTASALMEEQAGLVDMETRVKLEEAINAFLADAHLELQTGLARAFESPSWRKLAWYKLFWRVDDVPLIITDLTQQYWLKESCLVVFEMLGRLHQAGLIEFISYDGKLIEFATTIEGDTLTPSLRPAEAYPVSTDYLEKPDQPHLKSSELSRARQAFLSTTIPTMAARAQSSLFKMIGFTGTTAGLSALAYVSTLTPSVYECGAILALGIVFALRRLQKQWEACRDQFKQDIFGVGRIALKSTEAFMRVAVREGGRQKVDDVAVQMREEAAAAVGRAKKALDEIRKP